MDQVNALPVAAAAAAPPELPPEERTTAWINKLTFPRVVAALVITAFASGGTFAKAFVTRAELDQATAPLKAHTQDLGTLAADVKALQALEHQEAEERRDMRRQLYELAIKSGARVVIHLEPAELDPIPPTGGVDAGVPPQPPNAHRR